MHTNLDAFLTAAVKPEVTLRNLPLASFHAVLAAAALAIPADRIQSEREINAVLKDWLDHEGAAFRTDHVELRRMLVDFGLLARDGFGRSYWRPEPSPGFAPLVRELAGIDLRAAVARARADATQRREERAQRWRSRTMRSGAGTRPPR